MKKINLSNIKGKLTKEQMKAIMAGSGCGPCVNGACSGGCKCSGNSCV